MIRDMCHAMFLCRCVRVPGTLFLHRCVRVPGTLFLHRCVRVAGTLFLHRCVRVTLFPYHGIERVGEGKGCSLLRVLCFCIWNRKRWKLISTSSGSIGKMVAMGIMYLVGGNTFKGG